MSRAHSINYFHWLCLCCNEMDLQETRKTQLQLLETRNCCFFQTSVYLTWLILVCSLCFILTRLILHVVCRSQHKTVSFSPCERLTLLSSGLSQRLGICLQSCSSSFLCTRSCQSQCCSQTTAYRFKSQHQLIILLIIFHPPRGCGLFRLDHIHFLSLPSCTSEL